MGYGFDIYPIFARKYFSLGIVLPIYQPLTLLKREDTYQVPFPLTCQPPASHPRPGDLMMTRVQILIRNQANWIQQIRVPKFPFLKY